MRDIWDEWERKGPGEEEGTGERGSRDGGRGREKRRVEGA